MWYFYNNEFLFCNLLTASGLLARVLGSGTGSGGQPLDQGEGYPGDEVGGGLPLVLIGGQSQCSVQ